MIFLLQTILYILFFYFIAYIFTQVKDPFDYIYPAFFVLGLIGNEFIPLNNPEAIVIFSIIVVMFLFYTTVSASIGEALDERSNKIYELFNSYFAVKVNSLDTLNAVYDKILNVSNYILLINQEVNNVVSDLDGTHDHQYKKYVNFLIHTQMTRFALEEIDVFYTMYMHQINEFQKECVETLTNDLKSDLRSEEELSVFLQEVLNKKN